MKLQSKKINLYLSDEELYNFRTTLCLKESEGICHNPDWCAHSHCLTWHRRNPLKYVYLPHLCPEIQFIKKGNRMQLIRKCDKGRHCYYAHSKEEELYHPMMYKQRVCKSKTNCKRRFCPFVHKFEKTKDPLNLDDYLMIVSEYWAKSEQNNGNASAVPKINPQIRYTLFAALGKYNQLTAKTNKQKACDDMPIADKYNNASQDLNDNNFNNMNIFNILNKGTDRFSIENQINLNSLAKQLGDDKSISTEPTLPNYMQIPDIFYDPYFGLSEKKYKTVWNDKSNKMKLNGLNEQIMIDLIGKDKKIDIKTNSSNNIKKLDTDANASDSYNNQFDNSNNKNKRSKNSSRFNEKPYSKKSSNVSQLLKYTIDDGEINDYLIEINKFLLSD